MTVIGTGSGGGHVSEEESAKRYVEVSISCTGGNFERYDVRGRHVAMIATAVSIMETVHVNMVSLRFE